MSAFPSTMVFGTEPAQNVPGMTEDEAAEGMVYSTTERTSGDASTLDSIGRLLELGGNLYIASRKKPGDVGGPGEARDTTISRVKPGRTATPPESSGTTPKSKTWPVILAILGALAGWFAAGWIGAVLGLIAGLLGGLWIAK